MLGVGADATPTDLLSARRLPVRISWLDSHKPFEANHQLAIAASLIKSGQL
jgi:hypothetical protein